ncbi:hypothetical protein SADUNF_Sadunf16G0147800 [Salix dunnii]|uniref:Uncharacterized protein n=1 Tax=Salix dunnii TaxID=1413687 RepID=A0A835MJ48_9ROSI|nr:hypothetical protein SADUNF_Sadunf16G0147800 [Salix dunnii]
MTPVSSNLKNKSASFPLFGYSEGISKHKDPEIEGACQCGGRFCKGCFQFVATFYLQQLDFSSASIDHTTPSLKQASLKLLNNVKEAREGGLVSRLRII